MTHSESIKEIVQAIHKVQQSAGTIVKGTKGQVGSKVYNYANLNNTWDTVSDLMAQNGLTVIASPTTGNSQGGQYFQTTIMHESGEYIQEIMTMTLTKQDPQAVGSAITYYRRYMLTSMLGLIPDDDNDAREQRLATAQQKMRIIGAVKEVYPDLENAKSDVLVGTIQNITGKFPGNIREDEADDMINLIKAFGSKTSE